VNRLAYLYLFVLDLGEGRVSRSALIGYFKLAGGPVYWSIYFTVIFIGEILFAACNWWLGEWSNAYEVTDDPRKVSITYWLGVYVPIQFKNSDTFQAYAPGLSRIAMSFS
jgi:hypothetical protein